MRHVTKRYLLPFALPATLLAASSTAMADWSLNPDSTVSFISTKNTHVSETHHFLALKGKVSESGKAEVFIDLTSVETGIPIRNQRLQDMLFETSQFSTLTISADLPAKLLSTLEKGETLISSLPINISLHGETLTTSADVLATTAKDGQVLVTSLTPLLVKADDFNLVKGIEALRAIAKLERISTTVPVTFTLLFNQD